MDNGLEICNWEFGQLCVVSGIARHLKIVRTPQQNRLAERTNRTLIDKVRCLLIHSGLPKTFWVEVTCTTAYLINMSPSIMIEKKTHVEMLSGHPRYPAGVKGYRLYSLDDESLKIVTSRNVVFNKSVMYKDTLKVYGTSFDKFVEELQDREPKTRLKPLRFRDESNMAAYVFVAAKEEDTHEPLAYQEAVAYEDNHLTGQKLVSCKWQFKIKERIKGVQKPRSYLHEAAIGYEHGNKICSLKKSLYGLKQSPRKWSYALDEYIYLLLYIDDMLIACKSKAEIGSTKSLLKKEFDVKELGEAKKILGMEIVRDRSRKILRVSQSGYVYKILNNFRIDNGKSVSYANAIGSLMYLMVCTRPDMAYAVSVVSIYLANPSKNHWEAVKWILKDLWSTTNVGFVYGTNRGNHVDVTGVRGMEQGFLNKASKAKKKNNGDSSETNVLNGFEPPLVNSASVETEDATGVVDGCVNHVGATSNTNEPNILKPACNVDIDCIGVASIDGEDRGSMKVRTSDIPNDCPNDNTIRETKAPLCKLQTHKIVKVSSLTNEEKVQGADVAIPKAVIDEICDKFDFTLYGYFIGSRLALTIMENYFASHEGMVKVLEGRPWFIKSKPIMLSIWSANTKKKREAMTKVPIIITNSLNVGIPPCQCTARQSASGKLDLARNGAVANVEYIFHLFKPSSQPCDSFSTLKVKGLALQEVTIRVLTSSRHTSSSTTP
nr:hypothetical protein [Tanacetum cinerariifolium]